MNLSSAYLLVSHGSRDPRPQQAAEELAQLIRQRLQALQRLSADQTSGQSISFDQKHDLLWGDRSPAATLLHHGANSPIPMVGTATLELASSPLHQQIQQFSRLAQAAGYSNLKIVPLFLLPGVHVMEDIPAEVTIAQQALEGAMTLDVCPYLGGHPQLHYLLTRVGIAPNVARILLAHGSRRSGANQVVEAIADQLEAVPAYWSVPPNLEAQITALAKIGCQQIAILPYFLFAGGITDAIAQSVADLSRQFPYIQLQLAEPLGTSAAMADLVVDLVQ